MRGTAEEKDEEGDEDVARMSDIHATMRREDLDAVFEDKDLAAVS